VNASKRLSMWIATHGAELRLCVRTTVAGVLAFVLASVTNLPQGYWAVLTAVIVVQASVGGSLKATIDRLIGTVGGAACGGVVALLIAPTGGVERGEALAVALAPVALLAALNPSFRIAPVTAVIVLLSPTSEHAGPIASALERILEIVLGSLVGLGTSLVILPARAHDLVTEASSRVLTLLADLLPDLFKAFAGNSNAARVTQVQDDVRAALARLESVATEAKHERRSRLSNELDPDPMVRTLLRLRSDLVMIARAGAEPLTEGVIARLDASFADVSSVTENHLRATSDALVNRRKPPLLRHVEAALDGFASQMDTLRRAGVTRGLSSDAAGRLFALGFALEQFRNHLQDLDSRANEWARDDAVNR
jgi:uncharacterized membrane protein YccC